MRKLLFATALVLLSVPATGGDTTLVLKSWGDNRPSDRFVSLSAHATETKDGLDLYVVAYDKVKVKQVSVTSGIRQVAKCDSDVCFGFWPKTSMSATNDVLVTATNINGAKFTVPFRLSRP